MPNLNYSEKITNEQLGAKIEEMKKTDPDSLNLIKLPIPGKLNLNR